jgi:hypothetical protein
MVLGDAESVTVGICGVVDFVALHCAVVPPPVPVQLQVYEVVFVVTLPAVPAEQRFVVGTELSVAPLLEPHEPFTGLVGEAPLTVAVSVTPAYVPYP